jgi:hypothetical protein
MPGRRHVLVLLLAACIALGLFGLAGRWAYRQVQIDACLDGGGCWDDRRGRCSNDQADCRRGQ